MQGLLDSPLSERGLAEAHCLGQRLVADIKVYKTTAQSFHLGVDGACHDIPGCKFTAGIIVPHEAGAIRKL